MRFLAYFVAALQTITASIGEGVLSTFQAPRPTPVESILTTLINEIAAIPERFVLILDDYHVINAQPIHRAITFLLDHLPQQMHLVIATRADPPLPIALLRGRGQLTELRSADLRFTPDEATEFINQTMGLELSAEDVAALDSRTEGWVAGLQMAADSMKRWKDIASFIHALTGSNRYVLDYLFEEVLKHQPASVRRFMRQTAILDHLTAPLCNAVTGRDDSQSILDRLERANLFIVPLDDERCWYRYHQLFSDLLHQRLHQLQPDLVPTLHSRASEWCEHNGLTEAAIDHALAAEDFDRAARFIEQSAEATLMRGELTTFVSWVEALPNDMVCARPLLCAFHAVALLFGGGPLDAVESSLRDTTEADTAGEVSGELAAILGWVI